MMTERQIACARAYGLLCGLVKAGHVPAHNAEQAAEIIAQYEAADAADQIRWAIKHAEAA